VPCGRVEKHLILDEVRCRGCGGVGYEKWSLKVGERNNLRRGGI